MKIGLYFYFLQKSTPSDSYTLIEIKFEDLLLKKKTICDIWSKQTKRTLLHIDFALDKQRKFYYT